VGEIIDFLSDFCRRKNLNNFLKNQVFWKEKSIEDIHGNT